MISEPKYWTCLKIHHLSGLTHVLWVAQNPGCVSPNYPPTILSFLMIRRWLYIKTACGLFTTRIYLGKEEGDAFLNGLQLIN